ncbi:hypothetical protein F9K94_17430 [Brucella tritici]|uniref:Uncharacterized protein n=1 Tax=Brucella tritici TaxID=94626 RepID=A0A7V7VSX4_9HYPH|nr:hypothetical protein [Brucella tritici]KAB2656281.1 hypothetical protein F9K94_17430 [Brucella tritici]
MGNDLILSPAYFWFPGNIYNQAMMPPEQNNSVRFCASQSASLPATVDELLRLLSVSPTYPLIILSVCVSLVTIAIGVTFALLDWWQS